jgi:hypothetical protein
MKSYSLRSSVNSLFPQFDSVKVVWLNLRRLINGNKSSNVFFALVWKKRTNSIAINDRKEVAHLLEILSISLFR